MHPDDAVDIVLQDLHSALHPVTAVRVRPAARPMSPLAALWRRYVEGWKWYAAAGLTPPAPEAGFPLRRIFPSTGSQRARRVAVPCVHHPLELLFGGAAAGCR
ncbi:hypothetical protein [Longimicrobium sp.]|uniref:hypothetical protein n=1 Tax=Longimicrobium sp. TaxID=2029185 RepID=UPI002C0DE588|nr:hypothetical protein [Longimicrobium sp.]HSU15480.1 hypothetical protein [Longimicrobium sp.]